MQRKHPKLFRKLVYRGEITLLTGLRVGASKDTGQIGSVDLPVVRRVDNRQPYIPGSSIKGKLRSLLRLAHGELEKDFKSESAAQASKTLDLFGGGGDHGHASRLMVRDAYLNTKSVKMLIDSDATDMPFTEVKFENSIDLVSGKAEHPRQIERIPAGAVFELEIIINVVAEADATEAEVAQIENGFKKTLQSALSLLKHDYLGGMGSRGYGQVEITGMSEPKYVLQADNAWTQTVNDMK
jgi:CRISPR-associated protein Csm3